MPLVSKQNKRDARRRRIRAKIAGTAARPRLAVFRSNRFVYAQLIDDAAGATLAAVSSQGMKGGMKANARTVGEKIAELAQTKKISIAVFDRGGFSYRGIIKEVADGARAGGLTF